MSGLGLGVGVRVRAWVRGRVRVPRLQQRRAALLRGREAPPLLRRALLRLGLVSVRIKGRGRVRVRVRV